MKTYQFFEKEWLLRKGEPGEDEDDDGPWDTPQGQDDDEMPLEID